MNANPGYWPSAWPAEDGGPRRRQVPSTGAGPGLSTARAEVTTREAIAATMPVLREPGEVFVLRHTLGTRRRSRGWNAIDPDHARDARPLRRSRPAARRGRAASPRTRTDRSTRCSAITRTASRPTSPCSRARELPRRLPYNSFVVVPDGHLITKDFGGLLPGAGSGDVRADRRPSCSRSIPRRSRSSRAASSPSRRSRACRPTATTSTSSVPRRCSACAGTAPRSRSTTTFAGRYRTIDGQTYGWDAVLALGAAWFLDNGEGSERYIGTFRGRGRLDRAAAPRARRPRDRRGHAHRDLRAAERSRREPARRRRSSAGSSSGYDSGNGVLAAFDIADDGTHDACAGATSRTTRAIRCSSPTPASSSRTTTTRRAWPTRSSCSTSRPATRRVRVDAGSAVQSVLFPAAGFGRDFYYCSFAAITRVVGAGS